MATNGLNGWTKWLVGTLWGVLVMVIMFMGNVVYANRETAIKEHKEIETHSEVRDAKQQEEIESIKEIVTDIRLEQREIIVTLANIEKKL